MYAARIITPQWCALQIKEEEEQEEETGHNDLRIWNILRTNQCSRHHKFSTPLFSQSKFLFPLSRLGYCNIILPWCPQHPLNRLQNVQNDAAHFILKTPRTDHSIPHLRTLHWLLISAGIKCKISRICFGSITFTGPISLSDLLEIYLPFRQFRSSADSRILCIYTFSSVRNITPAQICHWHCTMVVNTRCLATSRDLDSDKLALHREWVETHKVRCEREDECMQSLRNERQQR